MASPIGYLKLWRTIKDWQWYGDVPVRTLFLHILVEANWEEKKWKEQIVKPGSFITSTVKLADEMSTSRASIHRCIKKLESTGEIATETNNHWTAVTVVNWAKWQGIDETSERPMNVQRTSTERPAGTTKEVKKERSKEKSSALVSAARKPSSIEERKADFVAKCKAVVEVDPGKLPDEHRKPFFDYWTETTQDGSKMRFEGEKFFVHSRRMATWMTTANKITSNGGGFKTNSNGAKTYDGWTVEKVEAYLKQFKAENNGRYPNSGDVNIPKAYKLFKEWI